jgi:hypothetical protein
VNPRSKRGLALLGASRRALGPGGGNRDGNSPRYARRLMRSPFGVDWNDLELEHLEGFLEEQGDEGLPGSEKAMRARPLAEASAD